jgi:hypothetical protein
MSEPASIRWTAAAGLSSYCTEVALTIGAVMLGRAISHASAALAGVLQCWSATVLSASRIRVPRLFKIPSTRMPRALLVRSAAERYLPDRKSLARL